MTKEQTSKIFYTVYKHFNDNIDAKKYGYNIPSHMKKEFNRFCLTNDFVLASYSSYSKNNIILMAIVNQFEYIARFNILPVSDIESSKFRSDIELYINNFNIDIQTIEDNFEDILSIYKLYKEKKIKWYSMFFSYKLLRNYDLSIIKQNDIIINEFKRIGRLLYFFKFDEVEMKTKLVNLQKNMELRITNK